MAEPAAPCTIQSLYTRSNNNANSHSGTEQINGVEQYNDQGGEFNRVNILYRYIFVYTKTIGWLKGTIYIYYI